MDSSRTLLLGVIAVLLVASVLMVLPYVEYFLLAVVLAYVLAPLQRRLAARAGPRVAAAVLTGAVAVAVVLPLLVVMRAVATDAAALVASFRSDGEGWIADLEATVAEATGLDVQLDDVVRSAASDSGLGTVEGLLDVFGTLTHVLVGLGLTLFLLYYFLADGEDFFAWLRWLLPLSESVQDDLFDAIDHITGAVLAGHVLVAIIQGTLAGLGLFAVGIPNVLFWTVVMAVLSLLPVVGSFLVWGPAAVYLLTVGRPVPALFLILYGVVVVGVSDDYLRPVVIDRYARVSPAVIIIGVVGGLTLMGFIGIFVGPIVIAALRATLEVYREEFGPAGA